MSWSAWLQKFKAPFQQDSSEVAERAFLALRKLHHFPPHLFADSYVLAKLSANDRAHAVTIGLKRGIIEL